MPEKVLSFVNAGWEQGYYISPSACKGQCKGMSMRNTKKKIWKDKIFLSMMMLCLVAVIAVAANMASKRDTEKIDPSGTEETTSMEETEERQAVNGTQSERVDNDGKVLVQEDTNTSKSVAEKDTEKESQPDIAAEEQTDAASADAASSQVAGQTVLQYDGSTSLTWPIEGSLLMDYAMDHTVYHATLEQYKVSPGILIQGEVGSHVTTPAIGLVQEIGWNEEIGNFLRIDLGNSYEVVLGQLENITVQPGQYVAPGNILGTVAEPTRYYSVEGPNVYFQMNQNGTAIDPTDYLE